MNNYRNSYQRVEQWRKDNPEKHKAIQKRYYEKNKEEISEKNKWYRFKKKYGLNKEQYEQMMEMQDGLCGICGDREAEVVDHNHNTGEVRMLLCQNCNRGLGHFNDDPVLMRAAANYLEEQ